MNSRFFTGGKSPQAQARDAPASAPRSFCFARSGVQARVTFPSRLWCVATARSGRRGCRPRPRRPRQRTRGESASSAATRKIRSCSASVACRPLPDRPFARRGESRLPRRLSLAHARPCTLRGQYTDRLPIAAGVYRRPTYVVRCL